MVPNYENDSIVLWNGKSFRRARI